MQTTLRAVWVLIARVFPLCVTVAQSATLSGIAVQTSPQPAPSLPLLQVGIYTTYKMQHHYYDEVV